MATSGASVVPAPEGVLAAVTDAYDLASATVRRMLAGGYANDLYDLDTDRGRLVMRVVRPPLDVAGLEWETRVVAALAPEVPEMLAPLPAKDGSLFLRHGHGAVVVLPFVEGVPADRGDRGQSAEAAALLGRFHAAGRGVVREQRPGATRLADLRARMSDGSYFAAIGPKARPLPRELERRRREIGAAAEWMLALVETVCRTRHPVSGLLHGDYFRGNVLFRGRDAVALIDFEEMRIDWALADLANAAWEFCKRDDHETLDFDLADAFVDAYRAAGGTVPAGEDDLLVPLIRVHRILEVLRAPYDRQVDWDYQRANLDAFRRLG